MLGIFRRTKLNKWEIPLLTKVFDQLPDDFKLYKEQIKNGLFRGVITGMGDIPNYVAFTYNPEILKKYDDEHGRNYVLKGIRVFDSISKEYVTLNVYMSYGTINGYATPNRKKITPDLEKVDISKFSLEVLDNKDFEKVKNLFSESELKIINPSDVYEVELEGKKYYHLKGLEDGDFIGIDTEKRVYKFTHDPYEIKLLGVDLKSVLNGK